MKIPSRRMSYDLDVYDRSSDGEKPAQRHAFLAIGKG